jgi:hypothetical protein
MDAMNFIFSGAGCLGVPQFSPVFLARAAMANHV